MTEKLELVEVRKIWDRAPHNAFTDLIRFRDCWYCTFREGETHISRDGVIRLLASPDGISWDSVATIKTPFPEYNDLRDSKFLTTPQGELMLVAAAWHEHYETAPGKLLSLAWFSKDGRDWSKATRIGDPNIWLWRPHCHGDTIYAVGYGTQYTGQPFLRLYKSRDGRNFETMIPILYQDREYPGEAVLQFLPDGECVCLSRRNQLTRKPGWLGKAILGRASPPYERWTWKELDGPFASPVLLRLPDGVSHPPRRTNSRGRILAAGRMYHGPGWEDQHLALCELDLEHSRLTPLLRLPSGGDSCYAGMAFHRGLLWISYYSSHEGKTSIYLATVRQP